MQSGGGRGGEVLRSVKAELSRVADGYLVKEKNLVPCTNVLQLREGVPFGGPAKEYC